MIRFVIDVNAKTIVTAGSHPYSPMKDVPPQKTFAANVDFILPDAQNIDAQTVSFEGDSMWMLKAFENAAVMLRGLNEVFKKGMADARGSENPNNDEVPGT
jgi:hypothetical protein